MTRLHRLLLATLALLLVTANPADALQQDKSDRTTPHTKAKARNKPGLKSLAPKPIPLDQAKQRARMLHDIYESTLLSMHRHYFEPGKQQPIPSRAMEDVFYTGKRRWGVTARWLAVSAQAMNIDHKPRTPFEKAAVRQLISGKKTHEEVRDGIYRMAAPIVLFANCIRCHTTRNKRPIAGIVLSLPVTTD